MLKVIIHLQGQILNPFIPKMQVVLVSHKNKDSDLVSAIDNQSFTKGKKNSWKEKL